MSNKNDMLERLHVAAYGSWFFGTDSSPLKAENLLHESRATYTLLISALKKQSNRSGRI